MGEKDYLISRAIEREQILDICFICGSSFFTLPLCLNPPPDKISPKEKPASIGFEMLEKIRALLNNENILAIIFAIIMILLVIFTADTSPTWIYQGF